MIVNDEIKLVTLVCVLHVVLKYFRTESMTRRASDLFLTSSQPPRKSYSRKYNLYFVICI